MKLDGRGSAGTLFACHYSVCRSCRFHLLLCMHVDVSCFIMICHYPQILLLERFCQSVMERYDRKIMRKDRSELGVARGHSSVTILGCEKCCEGHALADPALVESKVTEVMSWFIVCTETSNTSYIQWAQRSTMRYSWYCVSNGRNHIS